MDRGRRPGWTQIDAAGQWAYDVDIPAKSGVSGGIVTTIPSYFGLHVFADPSRSRFGRSPSPERSEIVHPCPVGHDRDMQREVRASDAERELTVERLQSAMSQGRLSVDEFDDRSRAAYAATTRGELADLTRDLPGHLW